MASSSIVKSTEYIPEKTTDRFIDKFARIGIVPDLEENMELDFEIDRNLDRLDCYLTLAKPKDAEEITEIYKDCYGGTYPYREMEDPEEVREMIINNNYHWVLFKSPEGKTVGCFTYVLDFEQKKGYMRGLMVKKKFQSLTNIKKLAIGSVIGMWGTFRDKIYMWYAENRTAHAKSQFISVVCGVLPIAFLPNKDIFMNKVESDLLHIIYSEEVLNLLRKKNPILIQEVKNIYSFVKKRYSLENAEFVEPSIQKNVNLFKKLKRKINIEDKIDAFNYHHVKINIIGIDSYIKFLYNPVVQNIEKIEYRIKDNSCLIVLLKELKEFASKKDIRYIECFVSAYRPVHQKIFLSAGFKIRGYAPCWKRKEVASEEIFEDHIVFNLEEGKIDPNIQLVLEGQEIVDIVYGE